MDVDKRYLKKIKAAHLIYKENYALQDVAKILGISRPTLAKLIDEIQQENIVTIHIDYPRNTQRNIKTGCDLSRRYGLKDAIVVDAPAPDAEEIVESIGSAGADYLQGFLCKNMSIGTTGGKTIYALVSYLTHDPQITNLQVITTTGGSLYANTKYHSNTVAQRIVEIYHGTGHFIYAPTYADDKEQRDSIVNNSQIKHTLDMGRSVDIALTGIADCESARKYLPQPSEKWLEGSDSDDFAGAINTLLLNKGGQPLSCPATNLYIGISYEDLKKIDTVIALAGGKQKHDAIKAALLGGLVNVLVTDQYTAEYLLA